MKPGSVAAIWVKRAHQGPMDPVDGVRLKAGGGLVGNADQGGKRQITLIAAEAWARVEQELDASVDPSTRRANVLLRGIELRESAGRVLRVGDCRIRIRGETRPCDLMDRLHPGLRAALNPEWRAGAYGEILDDGEIAVGDRVEWTEET